MPARRSALLEYCRSLPLATEDVKWGADLVFSVGGKMFAGFAAGGRDATFGCKVAPHDFDVITRIEGIRPAPYAARFHWIAVDDPKLLPEHEAKALLRESYELVASKLSIQLRRRIDLAREESARRPRGFAPRKRSPKATPGTLVAKGRGGRQGGV